MVVLQYSSYTNSAHIQSIDEYFLLFFNWWWSKIPPYPFFSLVGNDEEVQEVAPHAIIHRLVYILSKNPVKWG